MKSTAQNYSKYDMNNYATIEDMLAVFEKEVNSYTTGKTLNDLLEERTLINLYHACAQFDVRRVQTIVNNINNLNSRNSFLLNCLISKSKIFSKP